MSTNKKKKSTYKKATKVAKKAAKKHPKAFFVIFVLLLFIIASLGALWYFEIISVPGFPSPNAKPTPVEPTPSEPVKPTESSVPSSTPSSSTLPKPTPSTPVPSSESSNEATNPSLASGFVENVTYDDFQIHFMTLGNDKAGDSVYIKAGDTDVLIDAGSRSGSFTTTSAYINQYCTDGKLEYVIATHGDQDHIEAFPKFANAYKFGTIITNRYSNKNTTGYKNMISAFTAKKDSKEANWYFADECWNNQNGASRSYVLSNKVTMDIIYNYYYFDNDGNGKADSSDENNFSVCTMFTYNDNGNKHYFFLTGDLEKEGEEKLSTYYDGSTQDKTLPQIDLFKAGHHGSKTSSTDCLLKLIQPKMCVVSCCCGTNEYTGVTDNQFPTQLFINRIAKYTDRVYVTSIYDSYTIATKKDGENVPGVSVGKEYISTSGYKPMNGNVIVSCNGEGIGIHCSNNYTVLKDTEWFNLDITIDGVKRKMRTWPEDGK